jgi:hypothetical protein
MAFSWEFARDADSLRETSEDSAARASNAQTELHKLL